MGQINPCGTVEAKYVTVRAGNLDLSPQVRFLIFRLTKDDLRLLAKPATESRRRTNKPLGHELGAEWSAVLEYEGMGMLRR